jgi:transcriptional regulator with XRE-family HTH domain
MNLSNHIKLLRTALGLSQLEVADKLGITQQAYSQIEQRPDNTKLSVLRSLADILHVDLMTLLAENEVLHQTNINQQGGQSATKLVIQGRNELDEVTKKLITTLEGEIQFLRNQLSVK